MNGWPEDKKWSDKYISEIKAILGQTFIDQAPIEEDMLHNTDFIVLKMEPIRIACRIRRAVHIKYKHDFTIRATRPSGNETELSKLLKGWGDYFFYGFADDESLITWKIGDLEIFRDWYHRQLFNQLPFKLIKNKDNSSKFLVFKWSEFPPEFIIARH